MRPFSCLLVLLLSAALVAGQTPPLPVKPQEVPLVRVTTRLVQISVVAKDKKGNPVEGLTREDFELLEDGKPQVIQVFSSERLELLPSDAPAPPNQFSNYLDPRGNRPSSATVILLDGLNTQFADQSYSRMQIIKFLNQLQPGDRIALYTLGSRLRVLHDFTADAEVLLRALDRYRPGYSAQLAASEPEVSDTGDQDLDDFLNEGNQVMADFYTVNRVQKTIQAFELISNHLAGFPGRKNLVWVSGSFPFSIGIDDMGTPSNPAPGRERRIFSSDIERAVRALSAAGVAVYPVDASGLVAPFRTPPPDVRGRPRGPLPMQVGSSSWSRFETMTDLAERTGGRAFYNTNDIRGAIRRAIDDSRLTYLLGYYPSHGEWHGKFHSIKIKVRRPGITVRARSGYFALPEPTFNPQEGEWLMKAAAWNPLDSTGVRFSVRARRFHAAGGERVKLDMSFVPEDVHLALREGTYEGALECLLVQRAKDGQVYTTLVQRLPLRLSKADYTRMRAEGMTLSRDFELLPTVDFVMVVTRDPISGSLGSVRIPLDRVPAPN